MTGSVRVIRLNLARDQVSIHADLRLRYPKVIDLHWKLDAPTGPGAVFAGEHCLAKLEHTGEPLVRFLVGPASHLKVCYEPPHRSVNASWGFLGCSYDFGAKRGFLEEWNSRYAKREHIYARVLPADMEAPIDELDAEITRAEALVEKLYAERRELLLSAAQRGDKVRVPKKESV